MKHRSVPTSFPRSSPCCLIPTRDIARLVSALTFPSSSSSSFSPHRSPGELVAYKLTAGTDSAVSTVFHVIRSRIIYLTTLDARSRNFYCFVTPGGPTDGVEGARKLDCDVVDAVLVPSAVSRAHPFAIQANGGATTVKERGFTVNLEMITGGQERGVVLCSRAQV